MKFNVSAKQGEITYRVYIYLYIFTEEESADGGI